MTFGRRGDDVYLQGRVKTPVALIAFSNSDAKCTSTDSQPLWSRLQTRKARLKAAGLARFSNLKLDVVNAAGDVDICLTI